MAVKQKTTYKNALAKKLARKEVFSFFKKKHTLIGLAGPDLIDYVSFIRDKGFSDIRIYENNRSMFLNQLSQLHQANRIKNIPEDSTSYYFGDIYNAPLIKDAVYDLDFISTIAPVEKHLKKFKDCKIILTVRARFHRVQDIFTLFSHYIGTRLIGELQWNKTHKSGYFDTEKGRYHFITYKDTAPMVMIFNF
jgi:hypothetical protein